MKYLLILALCLSTFFLQAQQDKMQAYIDTYKEIAIAEMRRTGVPASITLAQGLVESGCGEGDLCKTSNNHFGIKCKNEWTGDKVYHDDDEKSECFRSYASAVESFRDHSDFLKTRDIYAFLFKLDPTDYKGWAKGLKKAGYATERDYPEKLIKVINDYDLNQYTLIALNSPAPQPNDEQVLGTKASRGIPINQETLPRDTSLANTVILKDTVLGEMVIPMKKHKSKLDEKTAMIERPEDSVTIFNPNLSTSKVKDSTKLGYPAGVFTVNRVKAIYVQEGTSLLSLANQYGISLYKLLDYNDLRDVDVTNTAQLVFLDRKQTKGAIDFHTAKENESLLEISQVEGVRLEKILEYNKLSKDSEVRVGDRIWLRPAINLGVSKK